MEKRRAAATQRDGGKLEEAKKIEDEASALEVQAAAIRPGRHVVYYNGRHHGADLVTGLLKAFHSEAPSWKKYMGQGAGVSHHHGHQLADVLEHMVKACEEEEALLCLVIDEVRALVSPVRPARAC